ncbi:hypothetical protein [Galbibacter sp.]|uniref:hypothetical protein n=1 Tax=Galbibacter sp. TaxID=2918471 RepID=UPI003A95828D
MFIIEARVSFVTYYSREGYSHLKDLWVMRYSSQDYVQGSIKNEYANYYPKAEREDDNE